MRFSLTDENRELALTARRLFIERGAPLPPAWNAPPRHDRHLWQALADLGLLGLTIPESNGGAGAGLLELALVAEQAGAILPSVPFVPAQVATALLIGVLNEAASQVESIAAGAALAVPAWETFPDTVINRHRRPEVRLESGTLTGTLRAVPYGSDADLLVAIIDEQVVLVPLDRPGVRCTRLAGLDVIEPIARVEFAQAEARVLGPALDAVEEQAVTAIWTLLAAELVGLGQRAVDDTVAHAKQRHQFGRPIGSFQVIKHALADRHAQLDAARLLVYWAAASGDAHSARLAVQAAGDAADAATADNVQIQGGMGFTWEAPAHVLLKRARARRALLGSSGRQLEAIADLVLAGPAATLPR